MSGLYHVHDSRRMPSGGAQRRGRRIAIACDQSEQSEQALRWCILDLYRPNDVLILIHVATAADRVDPSPTDEAAAGGTRSNPSPRRTASADCSHVHAKTSWKVLDRLAQLCKDRGVAFSAVLTTGAVQCSFAAAAAAHDCDLAVVWSHCRKGSAFERARATFDISSSVSGASLHHLQCPVILYRRSESSSSRDVRVFASHRFSRGSSGRSTSTSPAPPSKRKPSPSQTQAQPRRRALSHSPAPKAERGASGASAVHRGTAAQAPGAQAAAARELDFGPVMITERTCAPEAAVGGAVPHAPALTAGGPEDAVARLSGGLNTSASMEGPAAVMVGCDGTGGRGVTAEGDGDAGHGSGGTRRRPLTLMVDVGEVDTGAGARVAPGGTEAQTAVQPTPVAANAPFPAVTGSINVRRRVAVRVLRPDAALQRKSVCVHL